MHPSKKQRLSIPLTATQKDVVNRMREGWTLVTYHGHPARLYGPQGETKRISSATFAGLRRRDLLTHVKGYATTGMTWKLAASTKKYDLT